ncbi:hypothetical protein [Bacillus subtilis]|uniref:mannitol dehydrogenase family protein n=1 Tax=Bacillus subtilis TaxID=1423 RepID=UPI002029BE1F|nr:hypothetical protein [Bacillus subtilis]
MSYTSVWDRFCNPFVQHQLLDIALNGVSKFRTRILPSLLDYVEQKKQLPMKLVFSLSSLIYFYRAHAEKIKDDETVLAFMKDVFEEVNKSNEAIAAKVLSCESLWGRNLTDIHDLVHAVADQLTFIQEEGMRAAVQRMRVRRSTSHFLHLPSAFQTTRQCVAATSLAPPEGNAGLFYTVVVTDGGRLPAVTSRHCCCARLA